MRQQPVQQPQQHGGYPPRPDQYGQGMPPASGEPMRLRPPTPAGASAFTPERGVLSRWGLPILVGIAAIVVIVVLVIALTGGNGGASSLSELPPNIPGQSVS
jgi:serine/threonine-protein kinase